MSETTTASRIIPAPAERIFNAWLDPGEHAKMTGSPATGGEGGAFTAWDGYISGRTRATTPHSRIEQAWRSTEFPEGSPDSTLVVELEEVAGGTRVTLVHSDIPAGQAEAYQKGWDEFYFDPMTRYFTSPGSRIKEVGEAIGDAIDGAGVQLEATVAAVKEAGARASEGAAKAVTAVKKVQKRAVARAQAVRKKVTAMLKPRKAKAKTPAKAKAPAKAKSKAKPVKKPAARKAAPKRAPSRTAPKRAAARKPAPRRKAR